METLIPEVENVNEFGFSETLEIPFFGTKTTASEFGLKFSPFGIKEVSTILSEYALMMYRPSEVLISSALLACLKLSNFLSAFWAKESVLINNNEKSNFFMVVFFRAYKAFKAIQVFL